MEILLLLPRPERSSIEGIGGFVAAKSASLHVVLPANHETVDVGVLESLLRLSKRVSTFSTSPVLALEGFQLSAIRVAVAYGLQRAAIPMHYQVLRGWLQREYDLRAVSDSQVLRALEGLPNAVRVRPNVYRSRERTKSNEPRQVIKGWSEQLKGRFTEGLFDLPEYVRALSDWYGPGREDRSDKRIELKGVSGWLEVADGDEWVVYQADESGDARVRCFGEGKRDCFYWASLTALMSECLEEISEDTVERLKHASKIRGRLSRGLVSEMVVPTLQGYTQLWLDYIRKPQARRQEQKWRGWYLVPEHGPLTLQKLRELQLMLRGIQSLSRRGSVVIDSSQAGIANAVALLETGQVKYQKRYTKEQKRNLLVRQQKNYLRRLGLITELGPNELAVSARGERWLELRTDSEIRRAFCELLDEIRWSWCNMPFFGFLRRLADRCGGWVGYRELYNWIIHAYEESQLNELVVVIELYRSLASRLRAELDEQIDKTLKTSLARHLSESAFGHYRGKVKDLMIAFATSGEFRLVSEGNLEDWRLVRERASVAQRQ